MGILPCSKTRNQLQPADNSDAESRIHFGDDEWGVSRKSLVGLAKF